MKRPPFCRVHTVIWSHLVLSISTIKATASSNTQESPNLNHIRHHLNMSTWPGKLWRVEIWPENSGQKKTVRKKGGNGNRVIKHESSDGVGSLE